MRLLLATNHLGLGGSESYLFTVAEQLDRLGHEIAIYSPEVGAGGAIAAERCIRLIGEDELADEFDAALVQDAGVSLQVLDRCPGAQQVFAAHSEWIDLQMPPQMGGVISAVVAFNDRVVNRMRAAAVEIPVVRLRQPIDTEHFVSRRPLPKVARRALLLSNTPHADRLAGIEAACERAGLELMRMGGGAGQTTDPRTVLEEADIVIGYGRSILEAMACGRAAYVYDWNGGDGWVTAATYEAIEADGFAGRSGREVIDADRLARELGEYSSAMGPVNHDLVIAHHRANVHAQQLVDLLRRAIDADRSASPRGPLQEMARLVRLEWRSRNEVQGLAATNDGLRVWSEEVQSVARADAEARQRDIEILQRDIEILKGDAETLKTHSETLEAEAGAMRADFEARTRDLESALQNARDERNRTRAHFENSASWRLTAPFRRLGRLGRRR